jgi:drug/metabolite transporter (DMT)-like permease
VNVPPAALALAAIALWGTLAAMSVHLKHVPPLLLVGTALLIGGATSLDRIREWRATWKQLALGVYGLFAYHLALFIALREAPAVEANLVNYLWPLLIVLLTPFFRPGNHLEPRHIIGAMLGFVGAGLLVTGGKLDLQWQYITGYGLALAAAFIWSTFSLLSSRMGEVSTAQVGLFCVVSGLLSVGAHFAFEPAYRFVATDGPWLLALGIGPMGLAFFAWDAALKRGDTGSIGLLSYLTPLLSTLGLVLTGGGVFTVLSGIAMLLIIGGALIGTWPSRR